MERSFEFQESWVRDEERTSVMIKNLPNKLRFVILTLYLILSSIFCNVPSMSFVSSRAALMNMLDEHCASQNKTADGYAVVSAYDVLYLPMDFKNRCNKGYAFVNFTTPEAAWRLYRSLMGFRWDFWGSSKITRISYARIQGKQALIKHFTKYSFQCNSDDFLPIMLSPPRHGSASFPQ